MDIAQMFQRLVADAKHLKACSEPFFMLAHEKASSTAVVSPDTSTIQLEDRCKIHGPCC